MSENIIECIECGVLFDSDGNDGCESCRATDVMDEEDDL